MILKKLSTKKFRDRLLLPLGLTTVFALTSCNTVIPQDVPLTFDSGLSAAPKYDGFDGALSAQTINEETVLVTWNTTSDNKVLYYNIYDSTFQFEFKKIKTVQATPGATQLTALLTKQTSNQHYKYRVRAVNGKNVEDDNIKDVDAIPYGGITGVSVLDGTTVLFKHYAIDLNQSVKVYCAQKNPSQDGFDTFAPPKTPEEYNLEVTMGTSCTTFCGETLSDTTTKVTGFTSGIKYVCRVGLTVDNFTDNNVQTGPAGLQPFIPVGEAEHLTFITNPPLSFTADNADGFKVTVGVMDKSGNNIITAGKTGDDSTLDITLKDDLGTQLAKVKAIAGVASFDKLALTKAGNRNIIASAYSSAGLVITGTSPAITVNAGAPSSTNSTLVIDPLPPGPYEVGDGNDPNKVYTLKVTLVDKFNNAITSNTSVDFTTTDPQKQPTISPTPIPVVNNDGTVTFKYPFYSKYAGPMSFSIRAIKNEVNYVPQSIVFDPGTPVGVKVSTPPYSGASIGAGNLGTVKVDIVDTFGNIVWNLPSTINITLNFSQLPAGSAGWLPGVVNTLPAPMPTAVPGYKDPLAGRAVFVADPTKSSSLGVDKAGQYKMVASGFGLNGTNEVTFDVLTGGPVKLAFVPKGTTGVLPTTGVSGACLGPIDIQVQDSSGNKRLPSSALSVSLSGNGSSTVKFFKNNLCNNPPAGISTPLSLATDTYSSIYIKDTGEATGFVTIQATDSIYQSTNGASGLTPATRTIAITPKALALNNLPTSVVAGKCTPITLNTVGSVTSNPNAAPTPVPKVTINGMGTGAVYAENDTTCSGAPLTANNISLVAGTSSVTVNFKDNAVMALGIPTRNLSLVDNGAIMDPGSGMFTMMASNLGVTPNGSMKVTAGACVGPFTVSLLDAQTPAVPVVAPSATNLKFVGTTPTGLFYTSNTCTTPYNNTTNPPKVQTSQTSTSAVYFKNTNIEQLSSLQFQDPANIMAGSELLDIIVTPASISLSGVSSAITNDCKPYTIKLLDAQATPQVVASLLAPVTVTLEAKDSSNPAITNTGGFFYAGTDVNCKGNTISQITFNTGSLGNQTVYFQALYPRVFTLHAVDSAATEAIPDVAGSSVNLTVNAAKGWLGTDTAPVTLNSNNTFNLTIAKGISPTQSRVHGFTGAFGIHFSQNKRWLYVADYNQHRVSRYDFNSPGNIGQPTYAGWIGSIWRNNSSEVAPIYGSGGVGTQTSIYGSNTDFDFACQFSANSVYPNTTIGNFDGFPIGARIGAQYATPGWCVGGQSKNGYHNVGFNSAFNSGSMYNPTSVVDDGNYIYVGQFEGAIISRYVAATGQFAGWVGRVFSNSNMVNAPDGVSSGCPTANTGQASPGWCIGGENVRHGGGGGSGTSNPTYASYERIGDGGIYRVYSMALATDQNGVTYIYVGDYGRVGRFRADNGTWQGWIGWLGAAATGGGSAFDTGPTACKTTSPINAKTPGWCKGGTAAQSGANDGHINTPYGILADADHNDLYVATNGAVYRYNLTTGAYIETTVTGLKNPTNMAFDGTNLYVTDENRIVKIDPNNPSFVYWMGKIAATPTSPLECNKSTNLNKLSPQWCIGGDSQPTLEEDGFSQVRGIDFDGSGQLFTSEYGIPRIQKWDISGGSIGLVGSLTQPSGGPSKWSNDISRVAQYGGYDDNSFLAPVGAWVHSAANMMYVVDQTAGRVKKIDLITGKVLGWIGGVSTPPTGGDSTASQSQIDAGCMSIPGPLGMFFTSNLAGGTAWCKGATLFPISIRQNTNYPTISFNNYDGIMNTPYGITGDGNYLYVTDTGYHRINKFNLATGQFVGWVGRVNGGNLPTGGACATTTPTNWNPTPGWCTGGLSANTDQSYANWDGTLYDPRSITAMGGKLYVVDTNNQRVVKYDAGTGAFDGWIGRVNTSYLPSSGCTPGLNANNSYSISKTGWCKGGRSATASTGDRNEVGGGFWFDGYNQGITNDGTNLYIAVRTYDSYGRIEKFDAANGSYVASYFTNISNITPTTNIVMTQNTNSSATTPYSTSNKPYVQGTTGIGCRSLPQGIWTDNTYLYVSAIGCFGNWANHIVKIRLSDGNIMGWQGGVGSSSITFTGGDNACTQPNMSAVQSKVAQDGYITPGWCLGGGPDVTLTMGGFNDDRANITGDSVYIYVIDKNNNRINRIPK